MTHDGLRGADTHVYHRFEDHCNGRQLFRRLCEANAPPAPI